MKVVAPTKSYKQVEGLTGRRYSARDGVFDMHPRDARALIAEGGFQPSLAGAAARTAGYRCTCGFGSYFRRCSRCGGTCEREGRDGGTA